MLSNPIVIRFLNNNSNSFPNKNSNFLLDFNQNKALLIENCRMFFDNSLLFQNKTPLYIVVIEICRKLYYFNALQ